ncbi:MAG: response regulator [Desulfobacteraceae bacterium]|nr:MAG: response regulator [Desulfobacteraceae bacterium]
MAFSILLVDDSLPMRSVIKRTLVSAGYAGSEFSEAANGQEALDLMQNDWIDLVITDYNMPVMNGLEFIKTVKGNDVLKEIPVIVVSTEGNKARIQEFMDSGAAGYITKPFTPESIRDLIIDILGESDDDDEYDDSDEDLDF